MRTNRALARRIVAFPRYVHLLDEEDVDGKQALGDDIDIVDAEYA